MHHSPWQPQGAHWFCPHCLAGRAGSGPGFCRKAVDSIGNSDRTYLRQTNMATVRLYQLTVHLIVFLIFFNKWENNDAHQCQGHNQAFKKDLLIHVLLSLCHWVSVWWHTDKSHQTHAFTLNQLSFPLPSTLSFLRHSFFYLPPLFTCVCRRVGRTGWLSGWLGAHGPRLWLE